MATTSQQEFHSMRGHMADGTSVLMDNGDSLTLRASMSGWVLEGPNGPSEPMPSAAQVERYIVSYGY